MRNGEGEVVVCHLEAIRTVLEGDLSGFEAFAIEPAKKWRQNSFVEAGSRIFPINIEKLKESGVGTILQNIHQQPIVRINRHMIRNNILYPPHVVGFYLRGQPLQVREPSQLRIQVIRVNYIIAVGAALDGFEYRRSVQVGYTQVRQIGNDWLSGLKAEGRIELKPIGRDWHIHERLLGLLPLCRFTFGAYGHPQQKILGQERGLP
jgi:hypothetical protein